MEYSISLPEKLCKSLKKSMQQGSMIEFNGRLSHPLYEEQLARIGGVKIDVFSNEHPPPHFRVKFQSSTANYRIADCKRINGSGEVLKYEKNILAWWGKNKQALIDFWDKKRPSDCPVGKYQE